MGPPGGKNLLQMNPSTRRSRRVAAVRAAAALRRLAAAHSGSPRRADDDGSGPVDTARRRHLLEQLTACSARHRRPTTKSLAADDGDLLAQQQPRHQRCSPPTCCDGLGLGDALPELPASAAGTPAARCPTTACAASTSWCGPATTTSSTAAGSELTALPEDDRPRPDRPEGAHRPRLPRRRRRHQGLRDLRQGRQHRDRRPAGGERAAPHAVPVAQGPPHLRRRPVHRRRPTSSTPPQLPEAEAQGRQPADRHAVRLGPRRLLGDRGRRAPTAPTWAARTCPDRAPTPTARPGSATASRGSPGRAGPPRPERQDAVARPRPRRRRPRPSSAATTSRRCRAPTCANPHGIQAREDLDTLITSDYDEPRNIILNPVPAPSSYLRRPTVRTWDISDQDKPKLKAVSFLPDGPRVGKVAAPRGAAGGHGDHGHQPAGAQGRVRLRRCRAARSTTRPTSPSTSRSGARSST